MTDILTWLAALTENAPEDTTPRPWKVGEQSNIFFKLMEERYRQHSTIATTNLVYDEWPNFLGSRPMVEALSRTPAAWMISLPLHT
jgi:hypothetical protein